MHGQSWQLQLLDCAVLPPWCMVGVVVVRMREIWVAWLGEWTLQTGPANASDFRPTLGVSPPGTHVRQVEGGLGDVCSQESSADSELRDAQCVYRGDPVHPEDEVYRTSCRLWWSTGDDSRVREATFSRVYWHSLIPPDDGYVLQHSIQHPHGSSGTLFPSDNNANGSRIGLTDTNLRINSSSNSISSGFIWIFLHLKFLFCGSWKWKIFLLGTRKPVL